MSSLSPCSSQNKGVKEDEGLKNLECDMKINEIITAYGKLLWTFKIQEQLKFRYFQTN